VLLNNAQCIINNNTQIFIVIDQLNVSTFNTDEYRARRRSRPKTNGHVFGFRHKCRKDSSHRETKPSTTGPRFCSSSSPRLIITESFPDTQISLSEHWTLCTLWWFYWAVGGESKPPCCAAGDMVVCVFPRPTHTLGSPTCLRSGPAQINSANTFMEIILLWGLFGSS